MNAKQRTIATCLLALSLSISSYGPGQLPGPAGDSQSCANGSETASYYRWASATAAAPVLFFTDITSGPKSGNPDTSGGRSGQDGAIVTLWGRNLGSAQGSSQVYANGIEAASYYSWGNATVPADLHTYHGMQMISFQISHLAQDGAGSTYVVVNGQQSNSLPFTVRAGSIYFVMTSGNDDTGNGSWGNPWRTIPKAANSLAPGDIEHRITDRTKAIVAVDYAGQPCEWDRLREITNRHGLKLVADGCHALGAEYRGRPVGGIADLTAFSFHPVKAITTG